MATLKLKVSQIGFPLACTECGMPFAFNAHCYVHQCKRLPHVWCWMCLADHGCCARCGRLYTKLLKSAKP